MIDDAIVTDEAAVTRIVLCSGKVFYDLDAGRADSNDRRVAVVRLEQFYPFPTARLKAVFAAYPNAKELFWTQEEPQNMGAWVMAREVLE